MKSKWFYLFVGTLLIITACQHENKKDETKASDSIPVIVSTVKKISIGTPLSVSGNVEGKRTVKLGFMVAGKINYIGKEEGCWFCKDQLIASLDPASYQIAKEMADVQVAQVEDEYKRLKAMYDQHSISESDFAKVSFSLQQASVQQRLQAKNLDDTKLYAPFSGVLLKKLGEVGEITGVGIPQFIFSDISSVKISAFVPENELHFIKLGQEASVLVSALNQTCAGKIVEVGSVADPASRAFNIKIEIANPKMSILPGMIAEVTIDSGNIGDMLVVPVDVVMHDVDNQSFLFVADTIQSRAFKRGVSLGRLSGGKIEIVSGVSENESIVVGGQHKLVDGVSVIIEKQ